jgi:hypothetical protein
VRFERVAPRFVRSLLSGKPERWAPTTARSMELVLDIVECGTLVDVQEVDAVAKSRRCHSIRRKRHVFMVLVPSDTYAYTVGRRLPDNPYVCRRRYLTARRRWLRVANRVLTTC